MIFEDVMAYAQPQSISKPQQILDYIIKELVVFIQKCLKLKLTSNLAQILSLFYTVFTRNELNIALSSWNCQISEYYWHKAHLHRLQYGPGISEKKRFIRSNSRTTILTIQQAVQFAKQKKYFKPLAFGVHKVKLSNGNKETLPNYIRKVPKGKVWMDYRTYPSLDTKVSRSTFYRILDTIGSEDDKLLTALDSYSIKYGQDNFLSAINFIKLITFNKPDQKNDLIAKVHSIELYLKYDFVTI